MIKQFRLFFLFCIVFHVSCKEDLDRYSQIVLNDETCVLPQITSLITQEDISDLFDRTVSEIEYIPNVTDEFSIKGFYVWDEYGDNNGVFISIKKNKYREEGPDFIEKMVSNTKSEGETDAEGVRTVYEDFRGGWTDGAYSDQAHTAVWQLDNCILFKVVFNTPLKKSKEIKVIKQLGTLMTDNYYSMLSHEGHI